MVSYEDSFLAILAPVNTLSTPPEHPSQWFENNPGKKPPVELPVMECTLDQVRSTVKYFLLNEPSHRFSSDLVLLYFRKLAADMWARVDTNWISFGITIGKVGSEVGPLDIVDVKDCIIKLNLKPELTAGPEDDLWILAVLASVFYYSASGILDDKAIGAETLEQWKAAGFKMSQFRCFRDNNRVLVNVSAYRIMIAVFDMFLFRFPNHKLYAARSVTSISRFQGCAAHQSLYRLCDLINKDLAEVQKWLLIPLLQGELVWIHHPGQEMDQPYSYAPYFMVLQLSRFSPYSEYVNPNLYLFANIVRAIMNDRDGRLAKIPETLAHPKVPIIACIFAYILAPDEGQLDGLPAGTDSEGWIQWFEKHHSVWISPENSRSSSVFRGPPKALAQILSRIWSAFEQDPPNSVGRMLYELKPTEIGIS